MRRRLVLTPLFLLLALAPAAAQEVEPEEPDIVLPEIILRVDDFSVEEVEAALPEAEELLPSERQVPLPESEELTVAEPESPLEMGEGEPPTAPAPSSLLAAQVILGAGSLDHVYSLIALNRVGQEPRFKLRFLHQAFDGIAGEAAGVGEPAGSGFDYREYGLEGGLQFPMGGAGFRGEGFLEQQERGLQQLSPYDSRIAHSVGGNVEVETPLGEQFTLTTGLDGGYATSLLTTADPAETPAVLSEFTIAPRVQGMYRIGPTRLGLEAVYSYRGLIEGGSQQLQRLRANLSFGVDFWKTFRFQAVGGWFYNNAQGHLFPFTVSLAGSPWPIFSFDLSGGYMVSEESYGALLHEFPLAQLPEPLLDNHGWFGDLGLSFGLSRSLALNGRIRAAWNRELPLLERAATANGLDADGLFPLVQQEALTVGAEVGMRWNVGTVLTLGASLAGEFGEKSFYVPLNHLEMEVEANNPKATWGGKASLAIGLGYDPDVPDLTTMPLLGLSAFYKFTDSIMVSGEIDDLLYPLIDGPRYELPPFRERGLQATAKVQINL